MSTTAKWLLGGAIFLIVLMIIGWTAKRFYAAGKADSTTPNTMPGGGEYLIGDNNLDGVVNYLDN